MSAQSKAAKMALLPGLSTLLTRAPLALTTFEEFETRYERRYASTEERERRRRAFRGHLAHIERHNSRSDSSYRLAMNQWGDLTHHELRRAAASGAAAPQLWPALLQVGDSARLPVGKKRRRRKHPKKRVKIAPGANRDFGGRVDADENPEIPPRELALPADATAPPEVDWRDKGVVSSVRNQGECGACYAVVTAAAVEAAAAISSGAAMVPLSPQSVVDCSGNASLGPTALDVGNHGCIGGGIVRGFNYVLKNHGVVTEEAYPSHLEDNAPGNCSFVRADLAGRISAYVNVSANDTLLEFALTQNPVATAVDAHHRDFLFYDSGIFTSDECTDQVTHGVLVVGCGRPALLGPAPTLSVRARSPASPVRQGRVCSHPPTRPHAHPGTARRRRATPTGRSKTRGQSSGARTGTCASRAGRWACVGSAPRRTFRCCRTPDLRDFPLCCESD